MARFDMKIPSDIMHDVKRLFDDADKIFGEMTKAGAEVVAQRVRAGAPAYLRDHIRISKTYKTPSDGGINTKVYITGYLPFRGNQTSFTRSNGGRSGKKYTTTKGIPAEFVANIIEYGTSNRRTAQGYERGAVRKKPFFRKAFNGKAIENAMLDAQKKASGGLLDE